MVSGAEVITLSIPDILMVPSSISLLVYLVSRYWMAWSVLSWPLSGIWPTDLPLKSILSILSFILSPAACFYRIGGIY